MANQLTKLNRRGFLYGMGAALALPAMESLGGTNLAAAAEPAARAVATTASGAPLRTAFLYFPNGAIPVDWWPKQPGDEFELSPTLEPLAEVRDSIQILGGLDSESAEAGRDGGGDHARGSGTFLTGVRLNKSATDIRAGISIDQVIAEQVGQSTRFPSLELSCESSRRSGECDSGYSCAYQFNLAWQSATTPLAPEANPRLVFERLFGSGKHGDRIANLQRRRAEQRSILDFVMDDAKRMQGRLQKSDRAKLDEYLSGVREIESRIQKSEKFGDPDDPEYQTPDGVPASFEEHLNLMGDLMVLAFQTDSTRVSTLLLAHDGSNRSFEEIGVIEGHHELSHHQDKEDRVRKVAEIDRWYSTQLARFLKKLQETPDVDGKSLLDNSMIVYGSGNADGNRHTHSNLPIILAGGGGGELQTGRYVRHESQPLSNLYLTMADRLGIKGVDQFGDSTGRLKNV